ncbi:MAG: amidohydrolase family protein [Chitinophagaceae bacterium]|nr:amidohydrolase family protein [Chitinophagaceae bacterium]
MNMTKSFVLSLILFNWLPCLSQSTTYDIVIKNISVIDVQNLKIIPKQTIHIKDERIAKIERSKKYKKIVSDTIIDGTGKFILSGFWDMHIHICWKENLNNLYPTLFSYGITGVRDMGGDIKILTKFKNQVKGNPHSGPTLFGAGPILDGEKPVHLDFSVPLTQNNVRKVLDSLYFQKIDFLKVYSLLPKTVLDSIANYSKAKKIPFAGHVSEYVTPEEASILGQKSFEHLNRLEDLQNDTIRLSAFIGLAKSNNTWICPTLIIYKRKAEFAKNVFYAHSLYNELDNDLKTEWEQVKKKRQNKILTEEELLQTQERYKNQKKLVKRFYDNGIPLLLGTDFAGMQFIYPGYSLHEEMALLQDLGIPPFEILKMATINPTLFLGISKLYGTVEENKMADLIILNENPVTDIRNTLNINTVLKAGKIVKK